MDNTLSLEPIEIDSGTFLRQHFTLPPLPEIANQLQNIVCQDNVDLGVVVDLISSDPAILAQVLKVVNSAYFGLPHEITRVKMAVAYLGLNDVSRIVLTISVINALDVTNQKELNAFWRHSFYTALCAKHIAKKYAPHYSLDELWPPAMLHDIGKLVYLKFFPKHYEALSTYHVQQGCLFSDAEQKLGLPESSYFGSLLCNHWRLPLGVVDACECHTLGHLYDIQSGDGTSLFRRVICVANLLSALGDDHLNNETKNNVAEAVKEKLGWDESQFLMNAADIYELREKGESFLAQLG